MTLEDLRAFVAAYRAKSMSEAARRLGCTQGAVAQHVRRLEVEIGTELFVRQRRGVSPTEQGSALFAATDEALRGLDSTIEGIKRSLPQRSRCLRISTSTVIATRCLREPLLSLFERHHDLEVRIEPENTAALRLDALREGRADLALVPLTDPLQRLEAKVYCHAELMLMVHSRHAFAAKRHLETSDLTSIRYIAQSESSGTYRHLERAFHKLGVTLTPSEIVAEAPASMLLVEAGRGETFAPRSIAAALENDYAVKALAVPGVPPLPIAWAARDFELLPIIAHEFIDLCAERHRRGGRS